MMETEVLVRPPSGTPETRIPLFLADPWTPTHWMADFGHRAGLTMELTLLDRIFPLSWREWALRTMPFPHRLPYHLSSIGGRKRLLKCTAELLRHVDSGPTALGARVPM